MKNIVSFFKSYKREGSCEEENNTYLTSSHILNHDKNDPIVKLENLFFKIRIITRKNFIYKFLLY